jgi:hypothetical protein
LVHKEIVWWREGGVDWCNLAQDRNKWWPVVKMVLSLWVPYSVGNFLTIFLQEDCAAWCGLFPMCFLTKTSYEILVSLACVACSSVLFALLLSTTAMIGRSYKLLNSHYVIFSTCFTLSILIFVAENKDQFVSNSQVYKINTMQTTDLYMPITNLTTYQKGAYYQGIKIYNHLPKAIKDLSDNKNKFKLAIKKYLLNNSFYCLKEYFDA